MIVKILVNNKVYGLQIYENNENGEISIQDTYSQDNDFREIEEQNIINDNEFDDLMGTNDKMVTLKIPEVEK